MKIFDAIEKFFAIYIFKKTYKRIGKCLGCGQCCSHIYVRHKKNVISDEKEFEKLRYLHPFYSYLSIIGKDEIGLIFKCANRDEETKLCKIHKKRPLICRKYPQEEIFLMGGELAQNCGYKFTPYRSFDEVFKNIEKRNK